MGSMLVIVVMMGIVVMMVMEVVVLRVLIIIGELDLWRKFLLCLVQCHALVGRQILGEPPGK